MKEPINKVISLLPIKVTLTRKQAKTLIIICEDYEQVCNDHQTVRTCTAIKRKLMAAMGWGKGEWGR